MELSQHVSVGGHSTKHNLDNDYRATLDHIVGELSGGNVTLRSERLEKVYSDLFDDALKAYNAKQKRASRRIDSYYEKVRDDARGHKGVQNKDGKRLAYEQVVGIGNRDTFHASDPANVELARKVYGEYVTEFEKRFPHLRVFEAVIHVDEVEGGIHLHNAYVPWAEGYKQGMSRQQSLSKACENMGFDHKELDTRSKQLLEEVCLRHGIDRLDMGNTEHHKPTPQYKREQRELEAIRAEQERARGEHFKQQRVLSAKRNTVERSVGRLSAQETSLKRTTVNLMTQKKAVQGELIQARVDLALAREDVEQERELQRILIEESNRVSNELDSLESRRVAAQAKLDDLDSQIAERKALAADLVKGILGKSREHSEAAAQAREARADRDSVRAEVENLKREKSQVEAELQTWREMRAEVASVDVETKPLPFGYLSVKADEFAAIQEKARTYCANRDDLEDYRNWRDDLESLESSLWRRDDALSEREAAVEAREAEAERLYRDQVNVNERLEHALADLSWARSDLRAANERVESLVDERDGLKKDLGKANETIDSLKGKVRNACEAFSCAIKALKMLVHGDDDSLRVPNLPARAAKLIDALTSYASGWLRQLEQPDFADDVDKGFGLSPGISRKLDPPEPTPEPERVRSRNRGAR